jgi:hypothetical protein
MNWSCWLNWCVLKNILKVCDAPSLSVACDAPSLSWPKSRGWGASGNMEYRYPNWEKIRSNCWTFVMVSSSICGMVVATSLAMSKTSDSRNQSSMCCGVVSSLHMLHLLHYSWMWFAIWIVVVCLNSERISKPVSWWTWSWKEDKKALANDSKVVWDPYFSSTYDLADGQVSVFWYNHKLMEYSIMLLEDHHRWKVMMWLAGS